jgi:hypothetical protein
MLDRIIKFLGGFTKEEYTDLNWQLTVQRDITATYRAREEFLSSELKEEKADRQRLREIIFKKFNITPEENPQSNQQEDFQPIRTSANRWSNIKGAMERDDLSRARGYSESHDFATELANDFKKEKIQNAS